MDLQLIQPSGEPAGPRWRDIKNGHGPEDVKSVPWAGEENFARFVEPPKDGRKVFDEHQEVLESDPTSRSRFDNAAVCHITENSALRPMRLAGWVGWKFIWRPDDWRRLAPVPDYPVWDLIPQADAGEGHPCAYCERLCAYDENQEHRCAGCGAPLWVARSTDPECEAARAKEYSAWLAVYRDGHLRDIWRLTWHVWGWRGMVALYRFQGRRGIDLQTQFYSRRRVWLKAES